MHDLSRDAGGARQRPRPPAAPEPPAGRVARPPAIKRAVGAAPVHDAESARLVARSEPARGMISNPWVRLWTSGAAAPPGAPAPSVDPPAPAAAPAPAARHERRDAGRAPEPRTPPDESR